MLCIVNVFLKELSALIVIARKAEIIAPISNKFKPDVSASFPTQTTQSKEFVPQQQTLSEPLSFADQKMIEAFGVTLTDSEGEIRSGYIDKIWERTVWLRGRMYRVPGGLLGDISLPFLQKKFKLSLMLSKNQKSLPC